MRELNNSKMLFVSIIFVLISKSVVLSLTFKFTNSDVALTFANKPDGLEYSVVRGSKTIQTIKLDMTFSRADLHRTPDGFNLGNGRAGLQFQIMQDTANLSVFKISRSLTTGSSATDCAFLNVGHVSWYGGAESRWQYWPLEKATYSEFSYLTKEEDACAIAERYWLNSNGVFIYIDEDVPLFIDQNTPESPNQLCFEAWKGTPYNNNGTTFNFSYQIGVAKNVREAHMAAVDHFLHKPSGIPDERMFRHPIWSTWARYRRDINESTILDFADEILAHQFNNSQLDIDDFWEVCYGSLTFSNTTFANIANLTSTLRDKGFRTTLWVHPFINKDCHPWYDEAMEKGYVVLDRSGRPDTQWWNSKSREAVIVDFTKPEAAKWFTDRLETLKAMSGIDSFKFDAGESSWAPQNPVLQGDSRLSPDLFPVAFVRALAPFGSMIEIRTGRGTQDLPVFVRMLDKDSEWGWNNGLKTLPTTLMQMNLAGYPFVLPDMIGGNGYERLPEKELFIRWVQANVFMPSIQFSYVPWDYDKETIDISLAMTKLHEEYTDLIISLAKRATVTGEPINPPLWWADPYDRVAQQIDDEFMLGDDLIVAPMMTAGQSERDIYLPAGKWRDGNDQWVYDGPRWIMHYKVPLNMLPYFIRITP